MTLLRLPAGTDVAEMALFDVDALPQSRPPHEAGLRDLVSRELLVRFPTGADGGYLLHLCIDQLLPDQITQYCQAEDKLTGQFTTTGGRIGFGGLESTFQNFKRNPHIRSDATIPPGSYSFTAYRTEFPDELVEKAIDVANTNEERWLDRAPVIITLVSFSTVIALAVSGAFLPAALLLIGWYFSLRAVKSHPAYRALVERRRQAELDFPGIVVEMRLIKGFNRTPESSAEAKPSETGGGAG